MAEKLVQLMSGGFDSAGQAILLHEQGFEIYPLFVNFRKGGGKVEKEMRAVELVSERMGWAKPGVIKHHIPRVYTGAGKRKKSNQTRNRTMCKIAGSYAEQIGATHVAIGTAYMPEFAHMFTHPEADSTQSILQEQMPSGITIQTLDMYKTFLLSIGCSYSLRPAVICGTSRNVVYVIHVQKDMRHFSLLWDLTTPHMRRTLNLHLRGERRGKRK